MSGDRGMIDVMPYTFIPDCKVFCYRPHESRDGMSLKDSEKRGEKVCG